jgi:hypothetical protein
MSRLAARLALFFGLRARPAQAPELLIHRGERELCAGTAAIGMVTPPAAKLSAEEAHRCFGIRIVAATSDEAFRQYTTRRVIADELVTEH